MLRMRLAEAMVAAVAAVAEQEARDLMEDTVAVMAVVVTMVGKGRAVAAEEDWVGFLGKADEVCRSSHSHYSRCLHRKAAFLCYGHHRTRRPVTR
jgi:hypothetical protein